MRPQYATPVYVALIIAVAAVLIAIALSANGCQESYEVRCPDGRVVKAQGPGGGGPPEVCK